MKFPDITSKQMNMEDKFTHYMVVDPAGARNYTAIWASVNKDGEVYISKEFPERDEFGEWALFGDPKWRPGPATKKLGFNVEGYVNLFKEIEDELGIKIYERIGDSRFFAKENENNDDLFKAFGDYDMYFIPSDGRREEMGIAAVDEWFNYNPNETIDSINRPICFIHERCGNLIDSLINYGAKGASDAALKDFFDLIRYLRMANGGEGPDHITGRQLQATLNKKGGY